MITIYKNTNESSWSKYVLCISFSENIHQKIDEWQANLDKIVFDEQIETGSYHGLFPVRDDMRLHMCWRRRRRAKSGVIVPLRFDN